MHSNSLCDSSEFPLIFDQGCDPVDVGFIRLNEPVFFSLPLGTVPGAWWRWWMLTLWRDHSVGELLLRSQRGFHIHGFSFLIIFSTPYDHFSIFIYFLVTLCVKSVTRYAFFDGIHISHTYCVKIILAIVNYFMYHVRDENK